MYVQLFLNPKCIQNQNTSDTKHFYLSFKKIYLTYLKGRVTNKEGETEVFIGDAYVKGCAFSHHAMPLALQFALTLSLEQWLN